MPTRVYILHKGVNAPLEFRGLKGRYIVYAAGVVLGGLALYAILYACGTGPLIGLPLSAVPAGAGCWRVYYLSRTYGAYGHAKRRAAKRFPDHWSIRSRKIFMN